jgi:hypothetical protein
MTVKEFEQEVWKVDRIRLVIRDNCDTEVQYNHFQYNHLRLSVNDNNKVSDYLNDTILPLIGKREVIILMGNGEQPHENTLIRSVRNSY